MGLFGSLFTGVSALGAQSQATAMISNNIANVSTTGFKRSEASFNSLVTTESRAARYSPGTVNTERLQRVSEQGSISQTTSSTAASVSGNGMFAVKRDSNDSALTEFLYTRNGQFNEDAQGFLRNSAGFFLYGWPLDSQGQLPSNQGDLTSLVPLDVAFLGGLTRPTNTAELAINLDSREVDVRRAAALNGTTAPDFQRGLTVFDTLGNAQPINFELVKTYGPMATANTSNNGYTATDSLAGTNGLGLNDTDQFIIATETGTITLEVDNDGAAAGAGTLVQTIGDIINAINGAAGLNATAFLGNQGELVIQRDEYRAGATNTLTITDFAGDSALNQLGFNMSAGTGGTFGDTSSDLTGGPGPFGNYDNGAPSPADNPAFSSEAFPAFRFFPGDAQYNNRGWWQLQIRDPLNNILTRGMLNFDTQGSVNALPDGNGNVDINLSNVDWNNGSSTTQNISIDVSRFSQFASDYTVLFSDQDGAELGLRTGVEIDREGIVSARFSNGTSSPLYKIPLLTFANQNGLQEVSGTAYTETEESGEENLREAGSGGAGFLEPSTLENSNVDLADEFAKLIVSQRAFSAGTKVINTVDQMTEELLRLR